MADSGTLATSGQVLLSIGANASAAQILEANTNIWILMAEAEISLISNRDIVTNYASIGTNYKQSLAAIAAARAAMHGINQDQDNWTLAVTQSKLNVLESIWQEGKAILKDKDAIETMGL